MGERTTFSCLGVHPSELAFSQFVVSSQEWPSQMTKPNGRHSLKVKRTLLHPDARRVARRLDRLVPFLHALDTNLDS